MIESHRFTDSFPENIDNMKKLLLLALIIPLVSISAYSQPQKENPVEIASYNQRTKKITAVHRNLIINRFDDGIAVRQVRVEKQGDRFYLLLEGSNRAVRRLSRIALDDDGKGSLTLNRQAGTETCTGKSCQNCGFAAGGGCQCNEKSTSTIGQSAGICEHTITRDAARRALKNTNTRTQ
jgi:hypothetical protein